MTAIIGLECIKLGSPDDDSPHRMTVDVWENGRFERWQVTGHFNGWPSGPPERTIEELAAVQVGTPERKREIAEALDRLDREAAAEIEPIMDRLFREQVRVLYGEEGVALLDRDRDERRG